MESSVDVRIFRNGNRLILIPRQLVSGTPERSVRPWTLMGQISLPTLAALGYQPMLDEMSIIGFAMVSLAEAGKILRSMDLLLDRLPK